MSVKHSKLSAVFGDPVDERALAQIETCLEDERAVSGAMMADHHLGYSMPIGGVVAYDNAVSPSGVGFDIACGNLAVRTAIRYDDDVPDDFVGDMPRILGEIQRTVAFGLGRTSGENIDHELFDDPLWAEVERLSPGLKEKARQQLGTVGSGNHYVDLLVDEGGDLWVATHFGSRGFGHTIASGFLSLAAGKAFTERVPETEEPTVLNLDDEVGALYFGLMRLAGRYAYAGRDFVVGQVLSILGTDALESVHCHHNFAWEENGLIVVRKGATPLTREPAFIGGSMGDISVIVRGKIPDDWTGQPLPPPVDEIGALASAPHGAGRVMSRTKAAGKWKKVPVEKTRPDGSTYTKKIRIRDAATAAVNWEATKASLAARGIIVLGSGADEAPQVYKQLGEVLAHHTNIEVLRVLHPVGVVMAGDDTLDPYKD